MDEHLDPRHHLVLAQLVRLVEHAQGGLADPQKVLHGHELVERLRVLGHDGGAAAHEHFESLALDPVFVLDDGDEPQVMHGRVGAVARAGGERRLPLARHVLGHGVPDETAGIGHHVRRQVKDLVAAHAAQGA